MLKLNYFLTDFFILSAEKQPIKSSWRKIEWLQLWLRDADIAFYVGVNYIIIQGKWKFIELEMDKVS